MQPPIFLTLNPDIISYLLLFLPLPDIIPLGLSCYPLYLIILRHLSFGVLSSILSRRRRSPYAGHVPPPLADLEESAIILSSERGILPLLMELLRRPGARADVDKNAPIKVSSKRGHDHIVRFLLTNFPDVVDPSQDKQCALLYACEGGHLSTVELLLTHRKIRPLIPEDEPILLAAKHGHLPLFKHLLSYIITDRITTLCCTISYPRPTVPPPPRIATIPRQKRIDSLLFCALSNRQHHIAEYLIKSDQVNLTFGDHGSFREACEAGYCDLVKLLLEKKADPTTSKNEPLVHAASSGNAELVRLLLNDPRVDPNAQNQEGLRKAVRSKSVECVKLFLEDPRWRRGGEVVSDGSRKRVSDLLSLACNGGDVEMVKLMITTIRFSVEEKVGCMVCACFQGNEKIVKVLLAQEGMTPRREGLVWACRIGKVEVVRMLLEDGRPFEGEGGDILEEARKGGYTDIVLLLEKDLRWRNKI